jgi:hypothetical protein
MAKMFSLRVRCNCCRLGNTCMSPKVETRAIGDIPGCSQPIVHETLAERSNTDVNVTNYAEYLHEQTQLYHKGVVNGGIDYDTWWRRTWNYGSLRKHEGVMQFI